MYVLKMRREWLYLFCPHPHPNLKKKVSCILLRTELPVCVGLVVCTLIRKFETKVRNSVVSMLVIIVCVSRSWYSNPESRKFLKY
jgi:hypothetical protein